MASNDVTKLVENALQSGNVELLETLFSALSKTLELRSYQTGEEIAAQVGKTLYRDVDAEAYIRTHGNNIVLL